MLGVTVGVTLGDTGGVVLAVGVTVLVGVTVWDGVTEGTGGITLGIGNSVSSGSLELKTCSLLKK